MPLVLAPVRLFHLVDQSRLPGKIHLTFEASWPPGSQEFSQGLARLVHRVSDRFDLYMMVYPEEGDEPLTKNSYARTIRSFADGRWFTEVQPRAVLAELGRNPALVDLIFFEEEGALFGHATGGGLKAFSLARALDRAPDLGTMNYVLGEFSFVAYAFDERYHFVGSDPDEMSWLQKQVP